LLQLRNSSCRACAVSRAAEQQNLFADGGIMQSSPEPDRVKIVGMKLVPI
jgi:hypothetical protein